MGDRDYTFKPLKITTQRIRRACDNCYKSKVKCDQFIPCTRCKKGDKQCTRLRNIKKYPLLQEYGTFIKQYCQLSYLDEKAEVKETSEVEKKIIQNPNIISFHGKSDAQLNYKNSVVLILGRKERLNVFSSCISKLPLKLFYSPFTLNNSSKFLYEINPNIYLQHLIDKTNDNDNDNDNYRKVNRIQFNSNYSSKFNEYVKIGILNYFKYFNILLPLFTLNQFISRKRSPLLLYSIVLVGLTLLPETRELDITANYIRSILLKRLTPTKFPRNLSDLQLSAVLLNGLRGHKYSIPSYYFSNLIKCCHALGLHFNSKNKALNIDLRSERQLCYLALIYLDSIDNPYPMNTLEIISDYKLMDIYEITNRSNDQRVLICLYITYSQFSFYLTLYNHEFYKITINSIILKLSFSVVRDIMSWANLMFDNVFNKLSSELNNLSIGTSQSLLAHIKLVNAHIKSIYHACKSSLLLLDSLTKISTPSAIYGTTAFRPVATEHNLIRQHIVGFLESNEDLGFQYKSCFRLYSLFTIQRNLIFFKNQIKGNRRLIKILKEHFKLLIGEQATSQISNVLKNTMNNSNSIIDHSLLN